MVKEALTADQFRTFLTGKHFSAYAKTMPDNTRDDVFAFENQGEINSLEPCRVTYVPYKVYEQDGALKMDWVNLNVEYETFTVILIGENYFILTGASGEIIYTSIQ